MKVPNSLDYSLRRYYVDEFHARRVADLPAGSHVLDLGGTRLRKRGQFDIERYPLRVAYANLVVDKRPDVQADAARLPFAPASFDAVICSELLEHVSEPAAVLRETRRILKPGATLLICVPFLVHIHGDPEDFGRYTDHYWRAALAAARFDGIEIEKQGLFWSVLADMLRGALQQQSRWLAALLAGSWLGFSRWAVARDRSAAALAHPFYSRFATGFGILARAGGDGRPHA